MAKKHGGAAKAKAKAAAQASAAAGAAKAKRHVLDDAGLLATQEEVTTQTAVKRRRGRSVDDTFRKSWGGNFRARGWSQNMFDLHPVNGKT